MQPVKEGEANEETIVKIWKVSTRKKFGFLRQKWLIR